MKILELTEEVEKHLVAVVDSALKAGGLQMHHVVNQLLAGVKEHKSDDVSSASAVVTDQAQK